MCYKGHKRSQKMPQINEMINNIVEYTSWLNLEDIKKLPSSDRKIAKLAIEMQHNSSEIPETLKDLRTLSLVEKHLQQILIKNPIFGANAGINFTQEELLKTKPDTFWARLSRAIKNLFGRVSSQKLFAIYQQNPLNRSKIKAAAGDIKELKRITRLEQNPKYKKLLMDSVNRCILWDYKIRVLFSDLTHQKQATEYLKMVVKSGRLDDLLNSD